MAKALALLAGHTDPRLNRVSGFFMGYWKWAPPGDGLRRSQPKHSLTLAGWALARLLNKWPQHSLQSWATLTPRSAYAGRGFLFRTREASLTKYRAHATWPQRFAGHAELCSARTSLVRHSAAKASRSDCVPKALASLMGQAQHCSQHKVGNHYAPHSIKNRSPP